MLAQTFSPDRDTIAVDLWTASVDRDLYSTASAVPRSWEEVFLEAKQRAHLAHSPSSPSSTSTYMPALPPSAASSLSLQPPSEPNPFALGGWGRQWERPYLVRGDLPLASFPLPTSRRNASPSTASESAFVDFWDDEDEDASDGQTITATTPTETGATSRWSSLWSEPSFGDVVPEVDHEALDPEHQGCGDTAAVRIRNAYLKGVGLEECYDPRDSESVSVAVSSMKETSEKD
ncbi:hypothetical protein P7C73_g2333, partial [Tremellales sp. Uapishka_1]